MSIPEPTVPSPAAVSACSVVMDNDLLRATAEKVGVCVRPLLRRVVDTETGEDRVVTMSCGSTRERVCKPCADKARRVRMQQCREGWHLAEELPDPPGVEVPDLAELDAATAARVASESVTYAPPYAGPTLAGLSIVVVENVHDTAPAGTVSAQTPAPGRVVRPGSTITVTVSIGAPEDPIDGVDADKPRRTTRRREDAPPLPTMTMDQRRTIARELTSPNGRTYRPSMFLTVTLPSYGPVNSDGTPKHPNTYNYRRAARDAMHFASAVDRLFQNLRRCAGFKAQYFAAVEPQQRLALHLHAAVRGVVTRRVFEQVVAATYHQVWWPKHDQPVYTLAELPVWSETVNNGNGGYVDPSTGAALHTWTQAMNALDDDDAEPAHVVWFGRQADHQWFIAGSKRSDRRIGYLTKYLTKSIADAIDPVTATVRQRDHADRLARETRWLPCSTMCANWLRYGIQPEDAEPGLVPGECDRPAHDPANLGHGGRRVLVSRKWSGKRLTEHRADRAEVVRQALQAAGMDMPAQDRCSAAQRRDDGQPRYLWEPVDARSDGNDPLTWRELVQAAIRERLRWQAEYHAAQLRAGPGMRSDTRPLIAASAA